MGCARAGGVRHQPFFRGQRVRKNGNGKGKGENGREAFLFEDSSGRFGKKEGKGDSEGQGHKCKKTHVIHDDILKRRENMDRWGRRRDGRGRFEEGSFHRYAGRIASKA